MAWELQHTESVHSFLEYLALAREVSASTQSQALNALVFFFKHVIGRPLCDLGDYPHAHRPKHLPVVLSREEVRKLFEHLSGIYGLMAGLLYGSGLRLMECVRLRIKDVDFDRCQITVRDGKGKKDRQTVFPERFKDRLGEHLSTIRRRHENDLKHCRGEVPLPQGLERKFSTAPREWIWYWVFPAERLSVDPRSGKVRRYHIHESSLQRAIDVSTTMIYTHVLNRPGLAVRSPADM